MATAGARYEERTGNIWSYAHRGDVTGLKAALSRGVDVNMINTVGWTPAHAAAAGGQTKVLRLLAKNGADLEVADRGGDLPAHQAAKNGHVHALQVLRELGADITKVRLSQAKGKAAREELIKAYQKAGRKTNRTCAGGDGEEYGDESEEEEVAVGYARKQAKSTAFWGPRRQPISAKIKKKIIKEKRLKKKEKLERKWHNAEEEEETVEGSSNCTEEAGPPKRTAASTDDEQQEASYMETVRNIKRNKKHRRRQQQMRRQQQKQAEKEEPVNTVSTDDDPGNKGIQTGNESIGTSSSEEEDTTESRSRAVMTGFSAFSLMDSSDSEDDD